MLENICVECGMCCDGTMFGYAELNDGDDAAALTTAGLRIVGNGEQSGFQLPCPRLVSCACTMYVDRPSPCRAYKCALLLDHESGEVSTAAAREIIARTMELRDRVLPALQAFVGWPVPVPFSGLQAMMAQDLDGRRDGERDGDPAAELVADVAAVRLLLADHFDLVKPVAAVTP